MNILDVQGIQGSQQIPNTSSQDLSQDKTSWDIIQSIIDKMNSMSDELRKRVAKYLNDINAVSSDFAKVESDIKDMEKGDTISDAQAKKFADDLKKLKDDISTLKSDLTAIGKDFPEFAKGDEFKRWSEIGDECEKNFNVMWYYNAIDPNDPNKSIGGFVTNGNIGALKDLFIKMLNEHKKNPGKYSDTFNNWVEGRDGNIGMDMLLNAVLSTEIGNMNNEMNKYAQLISTVLSVAQSMVKSLVDLINAVLHNQVLGG